MRTERLRLAVFRPPAGGHKIPARPTCVPNPSGRSSIAHRTGLYHVVYVFHFVWQYIWGDAAPSLSFVLSHIMACFIFIDFAYNYLYKYAFPCRARAGTVQDSGQVWAPI